MPATKTPPTAASMATMMAACLACVAACQKCLENCRACIDGCKTNAENLAALCAKCQAACDSCLEACRACTDECNGAMGMEMEDEAMQACRQCLAVCLTCADTCYSCAWACRDAAPEPSADAKLAAACDACAKSCAACAEECNRCARCCSQMVKSQGGEADSAMPGMKGPSLGGKSWYSVTAKDNDTTEVMIYDAIGADGITAQEFVTDLAAITSKRIDLRLNTPGGEVFDGTAIHNAIRAHPADVIVHIDGVAASAGSVIAIAGDEVRMAHNAYLMIHEARGGVMGDSSDMRTYAGMLDKINTNIAAMYANRTGKPHKHYRELMSDETWFTAEEAKAEGLIDAIDTLPSNSLPTPARTAFDARVYNKIPDPVRRLWLMAPPPVPPIVNQSTPTGSPRGDASQASQHQEQHMPDTNNASSVTTAPVAPGASGGVGETTQQQLVRLNDSAINGFIDKGRTVGRGEGRNALMEEIRAIVAACPGRPQTALNAILSGQNASTVKLIVEAEMNAEITANRRAQEQEVEIAKLRAEQARLMELNNLGGHTGVSVSVFSPSGNSAGKPLADGLEPESQAKLEWDSDPMIRARNPDQKKWLLYRTQQLSGNVRVLARSA